MGHDESQKGRIMIDIKEMVKPLIELDYDPNYNATLTPDYVYGYYIDSELFYVGIGSDANRSADQQYKRARDIGNHNKYCVDNIDRISIKIEHYVMNKSDAEKIETSLMLSNNLLVSGANLKYSINQKNFWDKIIDLIKGGKPELTDSEIIQIAFQNARGQDRVEPQIVADEIFKHLDIDGKHDVLVVGNKKFGAYNLTEKLVEVIDPNKPINVMVSTSFSILRGQANMGRNNLIINTGTKNFLGETFNDKKFDIIVMNPPWKGIGIKFINHAVDLLKPGGKLVCIVSYNQFTDSFMRPGSFKDLQRRGTFERIESFKGKSQRDHFFQSNRDNPVGEWCWFIWHRTKAKMVTKLVNKLGQEFDYVLKGNEVYIPQLPNEEYYFDWVDGINAYKQDAGKLKEGGQIISRFDGLHVVSRTAHLEFTDIKIGDVIPKTGSTYEGITQEQFVKIFENVSANDLLNLYGVSQGGDRPRTPPLRKDLFND